MNLVPHRDWLLLPIIVVLTVLVLLLCTEGVARVGWPEIESDKCMESRQNGRPAANCTGLIKAAEGSLVVNQYNECAYRATGPCTPTPAGTSRIAVLGTSTSFGWLVPFDHVWSVDAGRIITATCGRQVDVQSLIIKSMKSGFGDLNEIANRLPEAIALHPQMVAMMINPFDLYEMPNGGFNPLAARQQAKQLPLPSSNKNLIELVKSLVSFSRAWTVFQHFRYLDARAYVSTYMLYGDRADFMRTPLSPLWQTRITYLDNAIKYMADQLKSIGIPMVLVFAPQQAQAYIIADGIQMPGVDAEVLDRAIARIAADHGVMFVDSATAFRGVKDAPERFYRANGHLNEGGHILIGNAVASAVLAARLPGFCGHGAEEAAK